MFNPTRGPAREFVDAQELADLMDTGTLVIDDRQTQPAWFDGRFLTAEDLRREQNYFLTRQTMLSRVAGFGVVEGLFVAEVDDGGAAAGGRSLQITPGFGLTPNGEVVLIQDEAVTANLVDVPQRQVLDATLGLRSGPVEPGRSLNGLFVLGLRYVEYTSNPIASYPTSINGSRSAQNGDIISATVITLIPYSNQGAIDNFNQIRQQTEREIFIENAIRALPNDILPLAMVALNNTVIEWVDPFLVRREIGAMTQTSLSFSTPSPGISPRSLRQAYLQQYTQRVRQVFGDSTTNQFTAAVHFAALPPVGEVPSAAIDLNAFTQTYFPAEVDVEISILPNDELAALVEESLLLPTIDLTLSSELQESTSVMILIPVPRSEFRQFQATLPSIPRPVRSLTLGPVAQQKPLDVLMQLKPMLTMTPLQAVEDQTAQNTWQQAVGERTFLWYVRRRNLAYKETLAGVAVDAESPNTDTDSDGMDTGSDGTDTGSDDTDTGSDDTDTGSSAVTNLQGLLTNIDTSLQFNSRERFDKALEDATRQSTNQAMLETLVALQERSQRLALLAAIQELSENGTDSDEVKQVSNRYTNIGKGLTELPASILALKPRSNEERRSIARLIRSLKLPELDKRILDSANPDGFLQELGKLLLVDDTNLEAIRDLIDPPRIPNRPGPIFRPNPNRPITRLNNPDGPNNPIFRRRDPER